MRTEHALDLVDRPAHRNVDFQLPLGIDDAQGSCFLRDVIWRQHLDDLIEVLGVTEGLADACWGFGH